MGLLDLISNLGRRNNSVYGDFLEAYGKLKEMKDVEQNFRIFVNCLKEEMGMGQNRCLLYIYANNIDRAILQLHSHVKIEEALIPIFEGARASYFDSDLAHAVWKYGAFPCLARVACEKCVEHQVYNSSLANHICRQLRDERGTDGLSCLLSGLVGLLKLEVYRSAFKELGLGPIIVKAASRQIKRQSAKAYDLLNFICFYEKANDEYLLEYVELDPIRECLVSSDSPPSEKYHAEASEQDYSRHLGFFQLLFKYVKSPKFKVLLIKRSTCLIRVPQYGDFIAGCIVYDPVIMAGLLAESAHPADWDPKAIYDLLIDNGVFNMDPPPQSTTPDGDGEHLIDGVHSSGSDDNDGPRMVSADSDTIADNIVLPTDIKEYMAMPSIATFIRSVASSQFRIYKFSLLKLLLDNNVQDARIYYFIYKASRGTFFSYMADIGAAVPCRKKLYELVYGNMVF